MNQKVIAIIPIKGLANVKRRLASRLRRQERAALVLRLLDRELSVLVATAAVDSAIVVTADDRVANLAEMRGALIALHPDNGVNSAIQAGIERANRQDAELIVALHGDLPFVETEDIEALIEASEPDTLVLAPDRRQQGTNAIVLRRGMGFAPHFGLDSYRRFQAAARTENWSVEAVSTAGLSFDLDLPADLALYRRRMRERRELQAGQIK